jgi:hypothetical protein
MACAGRSSGLLVSGWSSMVRHAPRSLFALLSGPAGADCWRSDLQGPTGHRAAGSGSPAIPEGQGIRAHQGCWEGAPVLGVTSDSALPSQRSVRGTAFARPSPRGGNSWRVSVLGLRWQGRAAGVGSAGARPG